MIFGMQVGLGTGHIVLDGGPAPPPQRGIAPANFGHMRCAQMVGWIKMSLGMEVGLGQGDFVLDWNPAPLPKNEAESRNFQPMSIVAKRLDGSRWHLAWKWALIQATLY